MCDDADDDDHRDDAEGGNPIWGRRTRGPKGTQLGVECAASSNPVEIYVSRIMKTKSEQGAGIPTHFSERGTRRAGNESLHQNLAHGDFRRHLAAARYGWSERR